MLTIKNKTDMKEYQKSQEIRLLDVFVIGPVILYAGVQYKDKLPQWLSVSLIAIGVSTIVYNGRNYLLNKQTNG